MTQLKLSNILSLPVMRRGLWKCTFTCYAEICSLIASYGIHKVRFQLKPLACWNRPRSQRFPSPHLPRPLATFIPQHASVRQHCWVILPIVPSEQLRAAGWTWPEGGADERRESIQIVANLGWHGETRISYGGARGAWTGHVLHDQSTKYHTDIESKFF